MAPLRRPSEGGRAYTETMWLRRVVLVLVSLATVFVGGTSLIRTVRGFYQLDFPVTWVAEGVRIDDIRPGSTGDVADLRPGDLVTSVDGVPIHRLDNPSIANLPREMFEELCSGCLETHVESTSR